MIKSADMIMYPSSHTFMGRPLTRLFVTNPYTGAMNSTRIQANIFLETGELLANITDLDLSKDPLVVLGGAEVGHGVQAMRPIEVQLMLQHCFGPIVTFSHCLLD